MAQTSQSPFNERDAGLLMVFADTGKEATEEEFHGKCSSSILYQWTPR